MKEVITMLQEHKSKDVVFIGIWGMAGSGKTTLARLIYELIRYSFKSTCFLSNVREEWNRTKSVHLQSKILSAFTTNMKGPSQQKLLVLDDVNLMEQLLALCRNCEWVTEGSRIIITTRDLHLLKAFQVDLVHNMKLLSHQESLQLLRREALEQVSPELCIYKK